MAASFTSFAQVGIGTTSPETSAVLDISSTTKALLITRVSDASMATITAVKGMVLYNTTQNAQPIQIIQPNTNSTTMQRKK